MTTKISMTHPGVILREEYFEPLGLTQLAAAKATGIPQSRVSEIYAGRRSITAGSAQRVGGYFGVDLRKWLNLQSAYDLWLVERDQAKALAKVQPLVRAA